MNQATRYRYEQRIKELREENSKNVHYRTVALRIYRYTAASATESRAINISWILEQFTELFK